MSDYINTVEIIGDNALLDSIIDRSISEIVDDLVTVVRAKTFYNCTALTKVDFRKVNTVGTEVFYGCSALTMVNFPSLVGQLGYRVFYGCRTLEKVDFSSITGINNQAFYGCSALTTLILRSATMCTLSNTNVFTSTPIASGTGYIYVPAALVDSYKAASGWSTYAAQFRALEDYTVDGTTTGALDESKI